MPALLHRRLCPHRLRAPGRARRRQGQFGVTQLKKAEGNEGFLAAHAKALAFYEEEQSRRRSEGLAAAAQYAAHRQAAPPPPWSVAASRHRRPGPGGTYRPASVRPLPPPGEERREALKREILANLLHKYAIKIQQERRCRLEGKIVEADYYLRQACWFETALELFSGDLLKFFEEFRHCGLSLTDIVASPGMLLLDKVRREQWAKMDEPKRPEHPPKHLIEVREDGLVTEPPEYSWSGRAQSHEEQRAAFEEQHRKDAEAQVEWEALARRDYEERRDRDASS